MSDPVTFESYSPRKRVYNRHGELVGQFTGVVQSDGEQPDDPGYFMRAPRPLRVGEFATDDPALIEVLDQLPDVWRQGDQPVTPPDEE
jgi:hypothetical protein